MTGEQAGAAVAAGRRRTLSRRHLERLSGFERLSPQVGALDEEAFEDLMADDPDAALALVAEASRATDPRLRQLARRLAARVMVDVARQGRHRSAGVGTMTTNRYEPDAGDIDLDASVDALTRHRAGAGLDVDGLRVRGWSRPTTALCLLVDHSGSMAGRPLAAAAVGAAAVAARAPAHYAVASFSSAVLVLKPMHERTPAELVIDDLLALRSCGVTDVAEALNESGRQLSGAPAARRVTVLFSDCRATAPGDVVAAARDLDELVIVAPEHDDIEAGALAGAVGARLATVGGPSDVPGALDTLLAPAPS
ncbi:MAG: VWA domain-containing protein [Actinomycetota bacterium]|nr:VWA domain-containing protein [Actinomycetota bacterium]